MIIIFIKIFILDLFIRFMFIKPSLLDKIYSRMQLNIFVIFGIHVKKSTVKKICYIILFLNIFIILNFFLFIYFYFSLISVN